MGSERYRNLSSAVPVCISRVYTHIQTVTGLWRPRGIRLSHELVFDNYSQDGGRGPRGHTSTVPADFIKSLFFAILRFLSTTKSDVWPLVWRAAWQATVPSFVNARSFPGRAQLVALGECVTTPIGFSFFHRSLLQYCVRVRPHSIRGGRQLAVGSLLLSASYTHGLRCMGLRCVCWRHWHIRSVVCPFSGTQIQYQLSATEQYEPHPLNDRAAYTACRSARGRTNVE